MNIGELFNQKQERKRLPPKVERTAPGYKEGDASCGRIIFPALILHPFNEL